MNTLNQSVQLNLLRRMIRIRLFEEKCSLLKDQKKISGPIHACTGQEASVVGVCQALTKADVLISTHRSHGSNIAKGASLNLLMAEIFGKSTGCSGGKGGSMHLFDLEVSSIMSTAIVGSGLPLACGTAFAQKYFSSQQITCVFFGDGASNEGTFHESLNLATAWKLPILFVLENNNVAVTTPLSSVILNNQLSNRALSYDMNSKNIDGQCVKSVYQNAVDSINYIRDECKPAFLEIKVQRFGEHQQGAAYDKVADCGYKDELLKQIASYPLDPIKKLSNEMFEEKLISTAVLEKIYMEEYLLIDQAVSCAEQDPFSSSSEATSNVYSN